MEQKQKDRCNQCFKFGLKFNGDSYQLKTETHFFDIHWTDILTMGDSKWNELMKTIEAVVQPKKSIPTLTELLASFDNDNVKDLVLKGTDGKVYEVYFSEEHKASDNVGWISAEMAVDLWVFGKYWKVKTPEL